MDDHQKELAAKLEREGHLLVAHPDTLLQVLGKLQEAKTLKPYDAGSPAGIVEEVDKLKRQLL